MIKQLGFTLIELVIFIMILGVLANTIFLSILIANKNTPTLERKIVALETAQQCMEWFVGQKKMNGYASLTCPSSTVPTLCSAPTGFTIATTITCTTIGSDTNYKTINVVVGGLADATLSLLIAS